MTTELDEFAEAQQLARKLESEGWSLIAIGKELNARFDGTFFVGGREVRMRNESSSYGSRLVFKK